MRFVSTNFMHCGRTVQGDSTVLSPLSAESWQPLSVLRVQARGSPPISLPSSASMAWPSTQSPVPWPSTLSRVHVGWQCGLRRYFSHSKHVKIALIRFSIRKVYSTQATTAAQKLGIILHSTHFALFLTVSCLLVFP